MYTSCKFIFYFCKLMGVAPVISHDRIDEFSKKNFLCNIFFLVILIAIGFHALFSDYKSTFYGTSARMKTRTAIVVTFLEVLLSMVVITSGIICAVFNCKNIKKVDNILKNIDGILHIKANLNSLSLVVYYIFLHHLILIGIDMRFWFNLTPYSWSYTVCYVYLFIEIAIDAQFALIAQNISIRFKSINDRLADYLNERYFMKMYKNPYLRSGQYFSFELFQELHWSLCDAMNIVNNAFGWQLLTSILCICVHIIVTPYFLLLDLFYPAAYGSADMGFLILQVVWIITHHIQLFLLIIPASKTSQYAKQAAIIICSTLQNRTSRTEMNQMEAFVIQLKENAMEFSACGLFNLQRPVITSLIGSVITYLVILIQFQNSDNVYH